MKKLLTIFILTLCLTFAVSVNGQTQGTQFSITADLPASTALVITPSQVQDSDADGNIDVFIPRPGETQLIFDTLKLALDDEGESLGVFLPGDGFFWALDIGGNQAGVPDVTITYSNDANPNNPNPGLEKKGFVTSLLVTGPENNQVSTLLANKTGILGDLPFSYDGDVELAGGFLRLLIAISDGSSSAPANSEPFTAADKPGIYSGTLTASITQNPA